MRFSELSRLYLSSRTASPKYVISVRCVCRRFVEANGDLLVGRIRERHVCQFFERIGKLRPATQAHQLRILHAVLRFGMRIRAISRMPEFPEVRIPTALPMAWTEEEFRSLFQAAAMEAGHVGAWPAWLWWQTLLAVLFYTGARVGAIMQLRWRDIDFERGTILLRAETAKTLRPQLHAVPAAVVSRLRQFVWPKRDLVFEHPYSRYWLFRVLRRIAKRVGLEPEDGERFALFHRVRRTAASLAARNGVALAQQLLGHSDPRTTVRHYVDPRQVVQDGPPVPPLGRLNGNNGQAYLFH